MSETKRKPEWARVDDGATIVDEHGRKVCRVIKWPDPTTVVQRGRLIAAAPEMHAALSAIPFPSTMGTAAEHYQRFYDWYKQHAEPAIAKAEGRS